MRRIGSVLHISPSQKAVIKAERIPRIGETVVDENNRRVGVVSDVLGSTLSPYVEVEVKARISQDIMNRILYISSPKSQKRSRRSK